MKRRVICLLMGIMLAMTIVSASEIITNTPDHVGSFEEWKIKVLQANTGDGYFAVTSGSYWGLCSQECWELTFFGDCNPCKAGEVASMCGWHPDSMSVWDCWSSATAYCNDWLRPYPDYNKQCYCKVPTTECSGGGDPGDRKCEGSEVWECSNSGTWEYVSNCDYGCSSGSCQQQQCIDHVEKRCDDNSVYWFDSCGERQEEYERCESDENCHNAKCVRFCEEGFIGSPLCSGNKVVQQYQLVDCSTDIRDVEVCTFGCQNSQCVDPQCPTCSQPTSWSQCVEGEMFRTNYECNADTNYECRVFTETQACECGTSNQCGYDETCEDNVCVQLECSEEEIADNHECIEKSSISSTLIIGIIVGVVILIFVILIVVLMIKMKGGQKKHNGK